MIAVSTPAAAAGRGREQLGHGGGGGEHDAAATPSVPFTTMFHAAHRPADRQRQAERPRPARPGRRTAGRGRRPGTAARSTSRFSTSPAGRPATEPATASRRGVETEGPERLAWRGHHGEHEQHRRGQLGLGRQPVDDRPPADVEVVGVGAPTRARPAPAAVAATGVAPASLRPSCFMTSEQPEADGEGDRDADDAGHPGREPLVVDALGRVVGQRAAGDGAVLGRRRGSPCRPRPSRGRRAGSWRTGSRRRPAPEPRRAPAR